MPYKFLNDCLNDFQLKIVNTTGIPAKTIDDCLNRMATPIRIEIWLIGILSIKTIMKNKNIGKYNDCSSSRRLIPIIGNKIKKA